MKYLYYIVAILCLFPFVTAPMALFCGILFSLLKIEKPFQFKKYSSPILQYSVVLMGFGMNLQQVIEVSSKGIILTACSVLLVFLLGVFLGKILKVERNTTFLISSGTAICGGSAIAAVSPIVGAKDSQISFSLTVVFVLNAIALFIFPFIGHYFNMSQESFGYWSAIAIHDTSSVVGAGAEYGKEALQVAATVKLARTLWIIPLSFLVLLLNRKNNQGKGKIKIPWFILYFVIAILIAGFIPVLQPAYSVLSYIGKRGMVLALFMIGSGFNFADLKTVGVRPFLLGVFLWIIISVSTLFFFL
ncbi:MAG: putative sulfate exporter family transporter [Bacteroidales bacterium]|nr:putative sulfate exporter family transporter [Bacteroidales bacterium]MBQ5874170.1 putative sulfate exporter family transporter [Bacteroidales bacterium]MBQ5891883.1 putative sulfate exporter family transporter [Bacteroidales bacterium]MEE1272198.1 putative sulfate exporter family transporter [Bacteroidales bacterium]